jgi:hydrogenase maturation protease
MAVTRTLVAGVGNLFSSDDGFGPEVARRLGERPMPDGAAAVDYGIRGTHLAYDLLSGWDRLILVDVVPPRGEPGRLHVLEIGTDDVKADDDNNDNDNDKAEAFDPHGMEPGSMLHNLQALGGQLLPTIVVGCEPAVLDDGIGLSRPVADAVEVAMQTVLELLAQTPSAAAVPAHVLCTSAATEIQATDEGGGPPCVSASPVA